MQGESRRGWVGPEKGAGAAGARKAVEAATPEDGAAARSGIKLG